VDRRYKRHIEDFWKGRIPEKRLVSLLDDIENERLNAYDEYADLLSAEIAPYDHILDTAFMFGVYPYKYLKG
jgi:hypothetical protein